jgi:hypothetical protein
MLLLRRRGLGRFIGCFDWDVTRHVGTSKRAELGV